MRKAIIGTALALSLVVVGSAQAVQSPTGTVVVHKVCKLHHGKKNCKFVKTKKIRSVAGPKGANGKNGRDGLNGVSGKNGVDGVNGKNGRDGLNGVSGYEVMTYDYIKGGARPGHDGVDSSYGGAGNSSVATVACSSQNKVALSGGYFIRNGQDETVQSPEANGQGVGVVASFPGRMDWSTLTPKPGRTDGWIVQFNGNGSPSFDVTLYVVCANA